MPHRITKLPTLPSGLGGYIVAWEDPWYVKLWRVVKAALRRG